MVRRVALVASTRPSATGTGGAPAPPNDWRSFFSGPAWELDEATGEYYLHLFSRKQPDLNWENPEVRAAIYSMMSWWLDRGVDGFRMDVINMISKDLSAARGDAAATSAARGSTSSCRRCTARCSRARDAELLTVGEMPGVTVEEARLFTDPARARGRHGLPVRAHAASTRATSKWDHAAAAADARSRRSLGRWQTGLADVGWNSLYWNNHDQPRVVSRFGDDGEHRVAAAKMLGTILHFQRGTPYVYQGEELGMTNAPWATIEDFRDIESINHYREAVAAGAAPDDVLLDLRRDGPRQRAHAGAVGRRARRPASRPASRGCRSTRTTPRSTPRRRARTPTRSSTTTGG